MGAVAANLRRILALRAVLRAERPDVALSMLTTCNVLLGLAGRGRPGMRLIGSERVHPPKVPLGRAWGRLRAWAYSRLDLIVVQTQTTAEWIQAHTRARRVAVIPNAIVWPLPASAPRRVPSCVGTPGRRRLLAAGRLGPQKRFDILLAAFANLAPCFPHWELVILGEGPDRATLERQASDAGLAGLAFMPGHVGNPGEWFASADLFVLTSEFEGFPNVLAEAMAHGLPTVSTDCDTGPRDLIRPEIDGLLTPPGDQPALIAALDRLMGDDQARARMARRAPEVRERFSMARVAALWDAVLVDYRR